MEEKFSFTILTKASSSIGLGHFNRCKILAEELIRRGNKVVLYVYGKKFTNKKKCNWIKFIKNKKNKFDRSNLCIVDTYNFKESFYKKLKKYFDNIVIFDDRNRNTIPSDVSGIINPNIYFKKKKRKIKYFGGKKYILLRKEFIKFKKKKQKKYIFLCLGGSDPLNQMPRFTKLLLKVTHNHIYAVVGPKFRNNAFLKKFKKEKRLKIFKNPKKINNLMLQSQFAVTSSGSMLYELIKLKVKTICVSLARNQIELAQYFAKKKLVKYLGNYPHLNNQKMILKLKKFQENLKNFKTNNLSNIIPGNGVENLVKDISIWLSKKNHDMNLIYSSPEIQNEYNISSRKKLNYEKIHWGSKKSMFNRYKFIKKILPFRNSSNWVDIGSGIGSFQEYILKDFPNLKGIGLEISKGLFEISKNKRFKNYKFKNMDFLNYNTKERYDLITCHGVMSKTNFSFLNILKKCDLLLNKNGHLLIDFTNYNWFMFRNKNFFRDPHHKWFKKEDIIKYIKKFKNFKIKKFTGYLPLKNKEVTLNKSHALFLILKKI